MKKGEKFMVNSDMLQMTMCYGAWALFDGLLGLQTSSLSHYSLIFQGKNLSKSVCMLSTVYIACLTRNYLIQNILQW